ncbi:glycosylhydrolase-like jelly roll fold domain-containing protein [Arthrobacter sp. UC242_113]|uniref:glycosylhydrolase-like jelly roll fold domain-containing protein n=1 Tax=Arthrobacter sp. UC242_113 TaxID=3374550 RepID=UPI0037566E6B
MPVPEGLATALERAGVGPDWMLEVAEQAVLPVIHRRLDAGELYFISNQRDRTESVTATFRAGCASAELWDAVRGTRSALYSRLVPSGTVVELELPPFASAFVLLRRDAAEGAASATAPPLTTAARELGGPWTVTFAGDGQSPAPLTMDRPTHWSGPDAHDAPTDVKYFSGTGTYSTEFDVDGSVLAPGERLFLDLGDVRDLAEVTLNGQQMGVVWTAPFRVEVTGAVRAGVNRLEIAVTNAWANRLAGDAAEDRTGRPGAQIFEPGGPLLPAGLAGPVRLTGPLRL